MVYVMQTWRDGDGAYPLSAARMGVIEQGIYDAHVLASGINPVRQPGVLAAADAALTIQSISQVTVAAAPQAYVQSPTSSWLLIGVALASTVFNPIPAAVTNPRLDQIVMDTTGAVTRLAGAEAAGATLANRTGAAAIPANARLLHDILVTTGGVLAANVRDRRPWARGGYARILRTSNAGGTSDYSTTSTGNIPIDATNLQLRMEILSGILRCRLSGSFIQTTSNANANFDWFINGAVPEGVTVERYINTQGASGMVPFDFTHDVSVAPGSVLVQPQWWTGSGTIGLAARSVGPVLMMVVEELTPQQNANNGTS